MHHIDTVTLWLHEPYDAGDQIMNTRCAAYLYRSDLGSGEFDSPLDWVAYYHVVSAFAPKHGFSKFTSDQVKVHYDRLRRNARTLWTPGWYIPWHVACVGEKHYGTTPPSF